MAASVVASTLAGCVGCQAGVEYLQREIDGSINLYTFCTFLFVSLEGLIFHSKFFTARQNIPTKAYFWIVFLFFIVNVANNYSLKFQVSMPLFIIFKSGSLLANLLLGSLLRKHMYSWKQIGAVLITTLGIAMFTLASVDLKPKSASSPPSWAQYLPFQPFWIGIFLLSLALFISAYLGICQEDLYRTYGKHNREAMFYVHFLSIPAFALLGEDIWKGAVAASQSAPLQVMGTVVPFITRAWLIILMICFLQFLCISNVYRLTAVTSSLNVTWVITLRKFISLFLSVMLFDNTFNTFHAMGTVFVFLGSLLFSNVLF